MDVPEDLELNPDRIEANWLRARLAAREAMYDRLLDDLSATRIREHSLQRQLDALHGVDRGALLAGGWID